MRRFGYKGARKHSCEEGAWAAYPTIRLHIVIIILFIFASVSATDAGAAGKKSTSVDLTGSAPRALCTRLQFYRELYQQQKNHVHGRDKSVRGSQSHTIQKVGTMI